MPRTMKRRTPSGLTAARMKPLGLPTTLPQAYNPQVKDRIWKRFEREQLPETVDNTLAMALNGDIHRFHLLCDAMLDTWPDLAAAVNEVAGEVASMPLEMRAAHTRKRDGKGKMSTEASASAVAKADDIEDQLQRMRSDQRSRERGFQATLRGLALGYYYGHSVSKITYENFEPQSTRAIDPQFFGYPTMGEGDDRLMWRPEGMRNWTHLEDFPDHNFLIGVAGIHNGHPSQACPFRPLVRYWLAATLGLKWMMVYSQIYGVPFRTGTYPEGDEDSKDALCEALENIGAAGYGAFPSGTEINLVSDGASGTTLPQRELVRLADEQAAKYILGQTLTTSQGERGSQSLGNVHEGVRQQKIGQVADWVLDIVNGQLIPAVSAVSYHNLDELPMYTKPAAETSEEVRLQMVERDLLLFGAAGLKIPVERSFLHERHGVPIPADGDDLLEVAELSPAQDKQPGEADDDNEPEDKPDAAKAERVTANRVLRDKTVEALEDAVLAALPAMSREWLEPAQDFFTPLVEMALSGKATPDEFHRTLQEAQAMIPELELDDDAFIDLSTKAAGTALLSGAYAKAVEQDKQA